MVSKILSWLKFWRRSGFNRQRMLWAYDQKCTELMRAQNACARLSAELRAVQSLADRLGAEKFHSRIMRDYGTEQLCVQFKCTRESLEYMRTDREEMCAMLGRRIFHELENEAFKNRPGADWDGKTTAEAMRY